MPVQINIFLLLFGGLQGLLFSLFLFRKKLYRGGYIFLLLYLGVLLLQITLKVMSKTWLMENWTILYFFSHYLPLLYGPLAWLFVRYLLNQQAFEKKDLLHFIPAGIVMTCLTLVFFHINTRATQWWMFDTSFRLYFLLASLFIYHALAYHGWKKHCSARKEYFSDATQVQLNWLKQFVIASFITGFIIITALYLLYINYPGGHEYRYGFIVLTVIIYWFSYTALSRPVVFSVIKSPAKEDTGNPVPQLKIYHSRPRYANSNLSQDLIEQIQTKLDLVVREQKLYLQPDLTIQDLAEKIHCSRHQLSQFLNEYLKKSYYDFINQFRVEEAKQILGNPASYHQKIASIAYESGFNSLSTFNEVFRKLAGQTPSQYRKQAIEFLEQKRV